MKYKNIDQYVEYLQSIKRLEPTLSLNRIKYFLSCLDNPQKKLAGIHITGTNGKGSVASFCQSILTQAGFKVGLFTSPHLVSYSELFRIGYKNISEEKLAEYLTKIQANVKKVIKTKKDPPTWFELLTFLAILYFLDQRVDFAIFEVGLGSRFDATNILDFDVQVVTNVALDHQKHLGKTISQIAKEKATIIKEKSKVITGARGVALKIIKEQCQKKKAKLFQLGSEIKTKLKKIDWQKTICHIKTPKYDLKNIQLSLSGPHQVTNAALALTACEMFLLSQGLPLPKVKAIRTAFKKTIWPGRFQTISQHPKIIIDSAHNPDGIKTLCQTFKLISKDKAIVLFAAKKGKKVKEMIKKLNQIASKIIFVDLPKLEKMYRASTLKKYFPGRKTSQAKSFNLAFQKARALAQKEKRACLICGSIYFLGEVMKSLRI